MKKIIKKVKRSQPSQHNFVFLIMSDFHFDYSDINNKQSETLFITNYLKALIRKIEELGKSWTPSYLILSGDIANRAKTKDYKYAKKKIKEIIKNFKIPS